MPLPIKAPQPRVDSHFERVRHYAHLLALNLHAAGTFAGQINDDFVRQLYLGAPLHDLGKVAIPDHILMKPGKLTCDEFEVMKRHTTLGAERLAAVLSENPAATFICVAYEIALHHHERFDGRGYPLGLAGAAIPLVARIVTVADVYDALTSVRVYKPAMPHQTAAAIIYEEAGRQFDPVIVEAFRAEEHAFATISAAARAAPFCEPHPRARWAFAA